MAGLPKRGCQQNENFRRILDFSGDQRRLALKRDGSTVAARAEPEPVQGDEARLGHRQPDEQREPSAPRVAAPRGHGQDHRRQLGQRRRNVGSGG